MASRRGRPMAQRAHLSEYQEQLLRSEADKLKIVDACMKEQGFASIRQFIGAYFSNKYFQKTQTRFFNNGNVTGLEEVLQQWLTDERVAPDKDGDQRLTPVEDYISQQCHLEFEKLLQDKKSCLRHMSRGTIDSSFQATGFEELLEEVQGKAPFLWRLFTTLGTRRKDLGSGDPEYRSKIIALMSLLNLLYSRNQQANGIQSLMSVYYKAEGTHKRALETMHRCGYVVSYTELRETLTEVAENLALQLKNYARKGSVMISVDNVNQMIRTTETRLDHKSYIDNSTAGYARVVVGLPPGEHFVQRRWLTRGKRVEMRSMDLKPSDACGETVLVAMKAHILDIATEYLKLNKQKLDRKIHCPHVSVNKLSRTQTKVWTFPLLAMEQGSVQGNLESLGHYCREVVGRELWQLIDELIPCSGDQLTLDRWRSIIKLKDTEPRSERFDWILPLLGLFHTKQTYYKMLTHTHWGSGSDADVSSIYTARQKLGREKIDEKCSDLWAMKALTDHMGEAQVLALLAEEMGCKNLEDLKYKAEENVSELVGRIQAIVPDYLGFKRVGLMRDGLIPRDRVRENGLLYLQHYLMVREYGDACSDGDIGRVKDLLDIWTLCFLGGKHYKYAIEMVEIQCGFQKEWSAELQEVVLQNWLVNITGLAGHFLPVDEFQEECVRAIKHIDNPGGSERVGEYLRGTLARLVCPFMHIRNSLNAVTGAVDYRSGHTRRDASADIRVLFDLYTEKGLFTYIQHRGSNALEYENSSGEVSGATDWIQEGMGALTEGAYWAAFVRRSTRGIYVNKGAKIPGDGEDSASGEEEEAEEDEVQRFESLLNYED